MAKPRTLFEKIWDSHVVATEDDGTCLLYIDRHLTHEVTTPQPYEGLRQAGRKVRRTDATIAVIRPQHCHRPQRRGQRGLPAPESIP